jgi:hypothetical protein
MRLKNSIQEKLIFENGNKENTRVSKEYSVSNKYPEGEKSSASNMNNYDSLKMNLSDRMKYKKEKAKMLLGKKRNTDSDEANSLHASTSSKNYIIEEDKLIPLTDKLDTFTKKEIKMLRNRMSAQKSRDKKKKEFDELKEFSLSLQNENKILKHKLGNAEKEVDFMKRKIKSCPKCSFSDEVDSLFELTDYKKDKNNKTNPSQNQVDASLLSTTVVDLSKSSQNNFNRRSKFGLLSGIILVCFIICCLIYSPFSQNNNYYNKERILVSENENLPILSYSLNQENTKTIEYKTNFESNKPIFKLNEDKYLLYSKRKEMIINIANKIRVAESIYNIFPAQRNNFREWYQTKSKSKQCLRTDDITSKIRDESSKNSLVTKDYFKNLELKTIPHLEESTESLLCQDYISLGPNKLDRAIENVR